MHGCMVVTRSYSGSLQQRLFRSPIPLVNRWHSATILPNSGRPRESEKGRDCVKRALRHLGRVARVRRPLGPPSPARGATQPRVDMAEVNNVGHDRDQLSSMAQKAREVRTVRQSRFPVGGSLRSTRSQNDRNFACVVGFRDHDPLHSIRQLSRMPRRERLLDHPTRRMR